MGYGIVSVFDTLNFDDTSCNHAFTRIDQSWVSVTQLLCIRVPSVLIVLATIVPHPFKPSHIASADGNTGSFSHAVIMVAFEQAN